MNTSLTGDLPASHQMPENKDDIDLEGWDLHLAAEGNRADIARALIARGDKVNAWGEWSGENPKDPLHHAAKANSLDVARLLIEHGAEVDARDKGGWTPLHVAVPSFDTDLGRLHQLVRLLIEHGAEVDARSRKGQTPLHWAASRKRPEVARLLIEHGANTEGIDLGWMDE